jgi:hypothetical protein
MLTAMTNTSTQDDHQGQFIASNWKPFSRNTLLGFFDLELPCRIIHRGCTLHSRDGKHWVSLPARKYYTKSGGEAWEPIVEIEDTQARAAFQRAEVASALAVSGLTQDSEVA